MKTKINNQLDYTKEIKEITLKQLYRNQYTNLCFKDILKSLNIPYIK